VVYGEPLEHAAMPVIKKHAAGLWEMRRKRITRLLIGKSDGFPPALGLLENGLLVPVIGGEEFSIGRDHFPDDRPLLRIQINSIVAAGGTTGSEFAELQRHLQRGMVQHRFPDLAG